MKAIYVKEPKNLKIVEFPVPEPKSNEIVVKVKAAGICGSDMHIYHGTNPLAKYPRVIGHEFAGEVFSIGESASSILNIKIGDHVAIDPVISCGTCYPCSIGRHNVCSQLEVFGVHRDGGMAEYIAVPAANAHVVPKDWAWKKAVMIEPFSIAANVLSRTNCSAGERVLILGAGPIGLTILMGAALIGAKVAVADVLDSRLEFAQKLGAEIIVNTKQKNLEKEMTNWCAEGIPLVIDAVCIPSLFSSLLKIASPAGRVAHLGFSETPAEIIPLEITKKELSIIGSRLNCGMFPSVIEWFKKGLVPEKLVSHAFPFMQAQEAFALIEEKPLETCKVLLDF